MWIYCPLSFTDNWKCAILDLIFCKEIVPSSLWKVAQPSMLQLLSIDLLYICIGVTSSIICLPGSQRWRTSRQPRPRSRSSWPRRRSRPWRRSRWPRPLSRKKLSPPRQKTILNQIHFCLDEKYCFLTLFLIQILCQIIQLQCTSKSFTSQSIEREMKYPKI